jgi:hypothetical protein
MKRWILVKGLAVLALLGLTLPASALRIAYFPPTQRALHSEVIVIGKVIGIEKQPVDLAPHAGAPEKVSHQIALVKVQENLLGAENLTHLKIAFIPPAPPPPPVDDPNVPVRPILRPRPVLQPPQLKEGDQFLFFLVKHPGGPYFMMPGMYPPLNVKDEGSKKEIENVKQVVAAIRDPLSGLKSDKPQERVRTAAILVLKFRSAPMFAQQVDQVPIDAELSRLILQTLAEADWGQIEEEPSPFQPVQAFYALGLTPQDGWNPPKLVLQPGQTPQDFNKMMHKAYVDWLKGPGKDYRIKKFVAKN